MLRESVTQILHDSTDTRYLQLSESQRQTAEGWAPGTGEGWGVSVSWGQRFSWEGWKVLEVGGGERCMTG